MIIHKKFTSVNIIYHEKIQKTHEFLRAFCPMDLRGVEPLSECLATTVSPITDHLSGLRPFPPPRADDRAHGLGSFIIRPRGQSLPRVVSHVDDAG